MGCFIEDGQLLSRKWTEETFVGEGLALLLCNRQMNVGSATITEDSARQVFVPSGLWLQILPFVRDLHLHKGQTDGGWGMRVMGWQQVTGIKACHFRIFVEIDLLFPVNQLLF